MPGCRPTEIPTYHAISWSTKTRWGRGKGGWDLPGARRIQRSAPLRLRGGGAGDTRHPRGRSPHLRNRRKAVKSRAQNLTVDNGDAVRTEGMPDNSHVPRRVLGKCLLYGGDDARGRPNHNIEQGASEGDIATLHACFEYQRSPCEPKRMGRYLGTESNSTGQERRLYR